MFFSIEEKKEQENKKNNFPFSFLYDLLSSNRGFFRHVPFRSRALFKLFAGAEYLEISKIS